MGANRRSRNLRTDIAEDIVGHIGVVLCIASELGKGKIETILIEEVGDLLLGVVVSAVVEFQCVECLAVVSTPVCKETYAGIGIGLSIGVVDVEVRVGDTGVNGHIVSIALALVIEDIVEHMDIGRVLATEGASGGLFGTTIKRGSVIINIDVTAEGVDPDARGDKLGGGGSTERNHVVVDGNTVDKKCYDISITFDGTHQHLLARSYVSSGFYFYARGTVEEVYKELHYQHIVYESVFDEDDLLITFETPDGWEQHIIDLLNQKKEYYEPAPDEEQLL